MARITIASVTAQLKAARAEAAQLRTLAADTIADCARDIASFEHQAKCDRRTILMLKSQIPAQAPNSAPSLDHRADRIELIKRYCAEHNCQSVTLAQLKAYAAEQHA